MNEDLFSVEIGSVAFEAAMQRIRAGVRDGIINPQYGTLPVQGRLLSEQCQKFTPPQSSGQGSAAVARDLMRIFKPISHRTFQDKRMRKIVMTDNRPAWEAAAKNFTDHSGLKGTHAIGFSEDWHKRNRISRGRGRRTGLYEVTLGPEGRKSRDYMAKVKKRVGWAKAGWNSGIIGLGGTVKGQWISRHGQGNGGLQNGSSSPDPFIHVWNSTSWAKYGREWEGNRILRNATAARIRDMESYAFRMARIAVANAGG